MIKDSLGDRCKRYENASRYSLPERMPVILRLDACNFHSYTKNCERPVDKNLVSCMDDTAKFLCKNIQGAQLAYVQSDEISLLLVNYKNHDSHSWFENDLSKMCSVASGMASAYFTSISDRIFGKIKLATFDCRGFVVPREDVCNVFLWRQQDATRNSVQMLARTLYSHKELHLKNNSELQEMCFKKGINWNNCPTSQKRGRCIVKIKKYKTGFNPKTNVQTTYEASEWIVDNDIPVFSKDRAYIENYVYPLQIVRL